MINFHTPTVAVPVLENSMYFDKEISFTLWVKTNSDSSDSHWFTFPRVQSSNNKVSQLFVNSGKMKFRHGDQIVFTIEFQDFMNVWTHVAMVITQDDSSNLSIDCYINGKLTKTGTYAGMRLGRSDPFEGFILGNDVDGSLINNPSQYAAAQLTELYLYNRASSSQEVEAAYNHRPSAVGRMVSWEEFSNMVNDNYGADVSKKPYPTEFRRI